MMRSDMATSSVSSPPKRRTWWIVLAVVAALCSLLFLLMACMGSLGLLASIPEAGGPARVYREHVQGPLFGPEVAIVMLQGTITSDSGTGIVAQEVEALLRELDANQDVQAVVLYINSPGGGVAASERIYHALRQVEKPIVAYFDETAASGGYYIAMAADHIVANPASITGAIGVIAVFPHAEALMDKVGIGVTVIKSGPAKDMGSLFREMTPEERAYMQSVVDEMYERFVQVVAKGRNLPEERVRTLADGRIYTGAKALELGLVDELGFEMDAVAKAAHLAGLAEPVRVTRYYPGWTWLQQVFRGSHFQFPWPTGLQPGVYYLWLP